MTFGIKKDDNKCYPDIGQNIVGTDFALSLVENNHINITIMDTKGIETKKVFDYKSLIDYKSGEVVEKMVTFVNGGGVELKAADAGTDIAEHSVPYQATLYVLDGEAEVTIDGQVYNPHEGQLLVVPANAKHSLHANKRFTVLLSVISE